ncbi:MAG: SDR family oxidoreductase, partial [Isosphaeraceae bacterium]
AEHFLRLLGDPRKTGPLSVKGRARLGRWGIKKLVPLKRWQEPEDIAAMAVFLASKQGQNIAGQTINVDGGYVMHW